jgi:integrase/recombinase XerD
MNFLSSIELYLIARSADGYSPATLAGYRLTLRHLAQYVGDVPVESITLEQLRAWFHWLRHEYVPRRSNHNTEPLTETTIHARWKAVRSFYNWAAGELGITNIALQLPAPSYETRPIIPYTQSEINKLLKACEYTEPAKTGSRVSYKQRRPTATRDKALIMLLLDTGLRVGEASRLQVRDLDRATGQLVIRPFGRGKKVHGRVVFVGRSTLRQVWRHLLDRSEGKLFPMSLGAMKHLVYRLGLRTGIDANPHKFRHTFAIEYLRNGGDVFTLQRLLGHKSLEMVNKYLEIVRADIESAHRRASPVDNWRL